MLSRVHERLLVEAYMDEQFATSLLADPRAAALSAGYSLLIAESLVGLPQHSLTAFAAGLNRRVYGVDSLPPQGRGPAVARERVYDASYG